MNNSNKPEASLPENAIIGELERLADRFPDYTGEIRKHLGKYLLCRMSTEPLMVRFRSKLVPDYVQVAREWNRGADALEAIASHIANLVDDQMVPGQTMGATLLSSIRDEHATGSANAFDEIRYFLMGRALAMDGNESGNSQTKYVTRQVPQVTDEESGRYDDRVVVVNERSYDDYTIAGWFGRTGKHRNRSIVRWRNQEGFPASRATFRQVVLWLRDCEWAQSQNLRIEKLPDEPGASKVIEDILGHPRTP